MEQQQAEIDEVGQKMLEALHSLPDELRSYLGGTYYVSASTAAKVVGRTPQTVSTWCRDNKVFRGVQRVPMEYKPDYLIPVSEVERVILENDFPRPGNPANKHGGKYPYDLAKREAAKKAEKKRKQDRTGAFVLLEARQRRLIRFFAYLSGANVTFRVKRNNTLQTVSLRAYAQWEESANTHKMARTIFRCDLSEGSIPEEFEAKRRATLKYFNQCRKEAIETLEPAT